MRVLEEKSKRRRLKYQAKKEKVKMLYLSYTYKSMYGPETPFE